MRETPLHHDSLPPRITLAVMFPPPHMPTLYKPAVNLAQEIRHNQSTHKSHLSINYTSAPFGRNRFLLLPWPVPLPQGGHCPVALIWRRGGGAGCGEGGWGVTRGR